MVLDGVATRKKGQWRMRREIEWYRVSCLGTAVLPTLKFQGRVTEANESADQLRAARESAGRARWCVRPRFFGELALGPLDAWLLGRPTTRCGNLAKHQGSQH